MYLDKDPEDGWDDSDPDAHKLEILERVVAELQAVRFEARRLDALRLVAKLTQDRVDPRRLDAIRSALERLA